MFFEKTSIESDMQLIKFGVKLKAVKYIINCPDNVGSHTIDVNVCVYDKSNVAKERLFDALEKIVATEPTLIVCFSNEKQFCGDKPNKTERQEHKDQRMRNVLVLAKKQKVLLPRTDDNVNRQYDMYAKVFCEWRPSLLMPLGEFKEEREINRFPPDENIRVHAQPTDDVLFENRARDERSYGNEHGLNLMGRLHDNATNRRSYFHQPSETRYVNESGFTTNLAHPDDTYNDISSREDDDLTYGDSASQRHITPTNERSHYGLSDDGRASVATRLNDIPSANLLSSISRQHGGAVQNLIQTPISSSPIAETRVLPNSFTQTCDRQRETDVQNVSFAQNPPQITFQVFSNHLKGFRFLYRNIKIRPIIVPFPDGSLTKACIQVNIVFYYVRPNLYQSKIPMNTHTYLYIS